MRLRAVTRAKCPQILGALILVVTTGMARADTIEVKMEKLGFVPVEISAHVGDTIEWVNSDFVAHTATARDGSWDVLIPVNARYGLTRSQADLLSDQRHRTSPARPRP
jgi:plastocyanin